MTDNNQEFREDMLKAINALQLVVKDLCNEVNLVKFSDSSMSNQLDTLNTIVRDGGNGQESLVIRIVKVEQGQESLENQDQVITGEIQILKEKTEKQLQDVDDTLNKLKKDISEGSTDVMVEGVKGRWQFAVQGLVLFGVLASLGMSLFRPTQISPEDFEALTKEIIEHIDDLGLAP